MDRQKFMEKLYRTSPEFDPDYVTSVVDKTLDRLEGSQMEKGSTVAMCLMEETGELTSELSRKLRGRADDNYGILEESADVIIDVLCVCKMFDINMDDLKRSIMIKCDRQMEKHGWDL